MTGYGYGKRELDAPHGVSSSRFGDRLGRVTLPSLIDRGRGLVNRGASLVDGRRLIDHRRCLDHRRRLLHHNRLRRDDVVDQVHDAGGKAKPVVVVMTMRRRGRGAVRAMRMMRGVALDVVHGSAAMSPVTAMSAAVWPGGRDRCAAERESCDCRRDEFLVVVHNTPSLSVLIVSVLFVSDARPSRAHIE